MIRIENGVPLRAKMQDDPFRKHELLHRFAGSRHFRAQVVAFRFRFRAEVGQPVHEKIALHQTERDEQSQSRRLCLLHHGSSLPSRRGAAEARGSAAFACAAGTGAFGSGKSASAAGGCFSAPALPAVAAPAPAPDRTLLTSGSLTVTVVPLPTSESMAMTPPCARTISRAMERPSPVPPMLRERALSTR